MTAYWSKRFLLGAALLVSWGLGSTAWAMQCQSRLISTGDRAPRVFVLCGQPIDLPRTVVYREQLVSYGHPLAPWFPQVAERVHVPVQVEAWVYNHGSHRFMRVVHFEDGVVTRIETLGYGFDPAEIALHR